MKKKEKYDDYSFKSSIVKNLVSLFFNFIKHFVNDIELKRKANKNEILEERFSTVEHLLLKLETKLHENKKEIESLKNRLMLGKIITTILLIGISVQMFILLSPIVQ